MVVLLDLPIELLSQVVSYLDHDRDLPDLLSLSLTSKLIHSITTPFLYRVFFSEDRYKRLLYYDVGSGRISKLIRLITTLNHCPELARYFREAAFIGEATGWDSGDLDFVNGDTIKEILNCLTRVTPESCWRHLLASIVTADVNPFVLMICATVPMLECVSLTLQDDFEGLEPLFRTVAGYDNSPYLSRLKKIHITGKYPISAHVILTMLVHKEK
ncbi:hypothetical protein ASPCAL08607 [Aspergillus calidoustus]|uniref:F-box domain-containing protein n=1 Tax=Aspergillus calidoustus TaxID=454130 RepID=A0A0U5GUT3_ASPCI|nr:hypothetical protein ASPCAL08607 [Aspergillus calidoustus]